MENKSQETNSPSNKNANQFCKQLGNIMYEVSINFKQGATETLDQKIIRIIKNELGVV